MIITANSGTGKYTGHFGDGASLPPGSIIVTDNGFIDPNYQLWNGVDAWADDPAGLDDYKLEKDRVNGVAYTDQIDGTWPPRARELMNNGRGDPADVTQMNNDMDACAVAYGESMALVDAATTYPQVDAANYIPPTLPAPATPTGSINSRIKRYTGEL